MTANQVQKYSKLTVAKLKTKAQTVFNKWIRERDKGKPCVNCSIVKTLQAGHFYPTSTHSHLRFHEDNVHGECLHCNFYNSQSHAYGYRTEIERRIGKERFEALQLLAKQKTGNKLDRFTLIEIIEKYGKSK